MNHFKKYTVSLLLLIALFTINSAEIFHHHDHYSDGTDESKCEACLFNHSLNTASAEKIYSFTPVIQQVSFIAEYDSHIPQFSPVSNHKDRAPPQVSHI